MRQFGAMYAFELSVDPADLREDHFGFDRDGAIMTALQLSRLVRDNGHTAQFAARLVEYEDGQTQVIPQGIHYLRFLSAYRLRNDRDSLTTREADD